jgi:hypothetical protein
MRAQPETNVHHAAPPVGSARGPILQRKCACGQHSQGGAECGGCRKNHEKKLQRRAIATPGPAFAPPIVHEVLRSSGQPLDAATRDFFEPRFGQDFSGVRVHSDARAAQSAHGVDALAYTVGQNIVFGAQQFAPRTSGGQQLLAHELTHVVQQSGAGGSAALQPSLRLIGSNDPSERQAEAMAASAVSGYPAGASSFRNAQRQQVSLGSVQCTPAPPTYKGVTGNRDMSKIRIDAIPDFQAKELTAKRDIHPHVLDPAIVHITWELFDPQDASVTGYSTTPGQANSTTLPFKLDPTDFSGGGFKGGEYTLRCIGLNIRHEPNFYADRDFHVLGSDLTTHTALPTTYGDLTFTEYKAVNAHPPTTPNYELDVKLQFLPKTSVTCSDVSFIQSMQTIDSDGKSQQNTVNVQQDARKTPLAWSIDALAGDPSPFYIRGRSAAGTVIDKPSLGHKGTGGKPSSEATLVDTPKWDMPNNAKFESCAMCRSGLGAGQVFGCATWGYTADAAGKVTLMPRSFRQLPSDEFKEARSAWNAWRTSVPAATRPEEAPPITKP